MQWSEAPLQGKPTIDKEKAMMVMGERKRLKS